MYMSSIFYIYHRLDDRRPICSMFITVLIIIRYIASADVICVLYSVVLYYSPDEGLTGCANAKKPSFP